MTTAVSAHAARKNFYKLIDDVNETCTPVIITNDNGKNAVIISEDDWNSMRETLYLNSIPGMTDSIVKAGQELSEECVKYNPDEEW